MPEKITTIHLNLPYRLGSVNCHLIDTGGGWVLVDTGTSHRRKELERELERAGCQPGNLKLVAMTHGNFDHTGNAAFLHRKYGAPLGIHPCDAGMLESGDMFWNRKSGNRVLGKLSPLLFGFGKGERCAPDVSLDDGFELSKFGWDARVLDLPGHSLGSIGILTAEGALFCGDLFTNLKQPELNSIMDNLTTANTSVDKLKGLKITTVYPGHGEPFAMEQLWKS